jgi:hypothetical protein
MIDFGNVVNVRRRWRTVAELAYDVRAHQIAQSLHMIGEALQAREVGLAAALCTEAEEALVGLRRIISDGRFN